VKGLILAISLSTLTASLLIFWIGWFKANSLKLFSLALLLTLLYSKLNLPNPRYTLLSNCLIPISLLGWSSSLDYNFYMICNSLASFCCEFIKIYSKEVILSNNGWYWFARLIGPQLNC
jgi:hypothetical protein